LEASKRFSRKKAGLAPAFLLWRAVLAGTGDLHKPRSILPLLEPKLASMSGKAARFFGNVAFG